MSKKRPNSAAAVAADRFRPGAFFLPGLVLFLFTALTTINAAANLIRAHVCSFAIYPEGTRSKSAELLPWHAGSLKIAQKANVPIVVGTVEGTERIARNVPWRRSHVYVRIREVIPAEAVKAATTSALTEDICGKMRAVLGK